MQTATARPLVPEDIRRPPRSARFVQRAAWAAVKAAAGGPHGRNPVAVARALYPDDAVSALLLERSAVSGATTTAPGWAAELSSTAVADFLAGLGPASAMSTVIGRGIVVPIGDRLSVTVPGRSPTAVGGWVGEGEPLAITTMPIGSAVLAPKKAGVGVVLTRELAQLTGAEAIFMLRESAGAVVDALYLSTTVATADGLPGVLHGVVPLVSAGDPLKDLSQLAEAVGGTDGSGETIFIASVGTASGLNLRNDIRPGTVILGSVAVPSTRLIAVDPLGIIHGISPLADIAADAESVLHMSDTPANISTAGSPATVAAPVQSMFQTAQIAMRMLLDLSWAKRRPAAVQYIDAIAWT